MPKDSIIMHYLDSLVSEDAREKIKNNTTRPVGANFFVIEMENDDNLDSLLRKKIDIVNEIKEIRTTYGAKFAASFFAPFAENHLNLRVANLVLKKSISNKQQTPSPDVLLAIADRLILTTLLGEAVFRDSASYQEQQQVIEDSLYSLSADWSDTNPEYHAFDSELVFKKEKNKSNSFVMGVSEWHNILNIWRFILQRSWRWLVQLSRLFAELKEYVSSINALRDNGLGAFFAYLGWVFFIPRILVNLCTIIYSLIGISVIFGSKKLPDIEKEYGWYLRLKIRLKDNIFFELSNDGMWFSAGLINCFSLAGALPIIGVYIMIAAQVYDFSVIMLRNFLDNRRLDRFMRELQTIKKTHDLEDPNNFLGNCANSIQLDKKRLLFAVFNFMVLLMCIVLMTQAFGNISPYIPLVASFITIIVAPLRGLTIARLRPPPSPPKPYGAIVVNQRDFDMDNFDSFGSYEKGFVGIKNDQGDLIAGYKYVKNTNNRKFTPISDLSKFPKNLSLFSRVKAVPRELVEDGLKLKFDKDKNIWASSMNSLKTVLNFGV